MKSESRARGAMRENVKREILQIGRDAESLYRYIIDHGDNVKPEVITAQVNLMVIHAKDLKEGQ